MAATGGTAVKRKKTWPIRFNGLLHISNYHGFYKSDLNRVNDIRGGLGLEPAIFTFGGHGFNAERPRYCDQNPDFYQTVYDLYWDRNSSFYISILKDGTINYIQQRSWYPANENHIDVTHSLILDEQARVTKTELGKTDLINIEVFEKCVGEFLKDSEIVGFISELLKQLKIKFFDLDVVDYDKVLGTIVEKEAPGASWEISYNKEGVIYALFEDVKSRGFNPSTYHYEKWENPEYNRKFTVEFRKKNWVWEATYTETEVGEPPQESNEKFTEELNRLLKTEVGREWFIRQRVRL